MREIEIQITPSAPPAHVLRAVEDVISTSGLSVASRGPLKSFPGSTHWHLKRGKKRGTLELTWWPSKRKLWIKIQASRSANWVDALAREFKAQIERRLA